MISTDSAAAMRGSGHSRLFTPSTHDQSQRFIDGEKGFIIPVARKRRLVLSALPAAGQAAYRLFYDSRRSQAIRRGQGTDRAGRRSSGFIRPISARRSATMPPTGWAISISSWAGSIARPTAGSTSCASEPIPISPRPCFRSKPGWRFIRLIASRNSSRFAPICASGTAGDKVTLGGQTAAAPALLERLLKDQGSPVRQAARRRPAQRSRVCALADQVEPVWQMRFGESVEAGMTPPSSLSGKAMHSRPTVPAVAVRRVEALCQLPWLSVRDRLEERQAAVAVGGVSSRRSSRHAERRPVHRRHPVRDPRFGRICLEPLARHEGRELPGAFRLSCAAAPENGEVIWQSKDLSDYAGLDLNGPPILAAGKIFMPAKGQGNPQQGPGGHAAARAGDSAARRQGDLEVGGRDAAARQSNRWWWGNREPEAQPRLVYRAGSIYVETHQGVFARLDADSGAPDWGFAYQTDPVQGQGRMISSGAGTHACSRKPTPEGSLPLLSGETFLLKGLQSTRLNAIDPNRMKVLWERPISKGSRLLAADDQTVYLGGAGDQRHRPAKPQPAVGDARAGRLRQARVLVRKEAIWQSTPRGIIELDPKTGAGAAVLPRQGPGLRRRRPDPFRTAACSPSPIARSPLIRATAGAARDASGPQCGSASNTTTSIRRGVTNE